MEKETGEYKIRLNIENKDLELSVPFDSLLLKPILFYKNFECLEKYVKYLDF